MARKKREPSGQAAKRTPATRNGTAPKTTARGRGSKEAGPAAAAAAAETKGPASRSGQDDELPLLCGARASDLAVATVEPLWAGRIDYGSVSIVQGEKGAGKSTWLRLLAAHVTAGIPLPDQPFPSRELGAVLWFAGEESISSRVRPGLDAAGADLTRCFLFDDQGEEQGTLRLPNDCARLTRAVRREGAQLVVIDPLFAFVGPEADVEGGTVNARLFMRHLRAVASETRCALVLSRNLTKDVSRGALASGRGSGEIGNAARSVLHLHGLANTPGVYGLAIASNNDGARLDTVSYRIGDRSGNGVVEVLGTLDLTADELASGEDGDLERSTLERAKLLIRQLVPSGRIDSAIVRAKAERMMIALRTLQLAAQRLGVRYIKEGTREDTVMYWAPPEGGWT